jgi:hypothetical protein
MTQPLHHTTAKSPQQCRRQHDSASTSLSSQVAPVAPSPAWLGSTVANMTQHLCHTVAKSSWQRHYQHDLTTPFLAWHNKDITQWLDRQHQQYMTPAASRHAASSYQYYSLLCLVLGPTQASYCAAWHLHEASMFRRLTFEDFKL